MATPRPRTRKESAQSEKPSATRQRSHRSGSEEASAIGLRGELEALAELKAITSMLMDAIARQTLVESAAPPQRTRSTLELATDVLENPGLWLRTANPQLGDREPINLISTDEEYKVYNLLNAVDQGLF